MKKNNNVFNYVDNIITWTDGYYKQFANDLGKIVYSESAISDLNKIVEEIVKLYNYIIENKIYTDNNEIQDILTNIYSYLSKIQINEQNAKKLDLKKSYKLLGKYS